MFVILAGGIGLLGGCASTEPGGVGQPVALRSLGHDAQKQSWPGPYAHGTRITTRHYILYTTSTDEGVPQMLPGFLEQANHEYHRMTGLPESPAEKPATVYMLANRDEWADLTRRLVKDQPNTYLSIGAGGYCYQGTCVFWDIGYMQTLPVAAHEGLHQFLGANLRDSLPMWAEEGLCVVAEGFWIQGQQVHFAPDSWMHIYDLKTALGKGYWIPLRELLSMDAGDAVGGNAQRAVAYYAQLWALVRYIQSQPPYRAGLERMIADARAGRCREALGKGWLEFAMLKPDGKGYNRRLSEPFFRRYITNDLDGFERAYTQYARELLQEHVVKN